MYALARVNTFDPDRLARSAEALQEFDRLHAGQPGFAGAIVVDLGKGRRLVVNLWESEEHARAAWRELVPEVDRLLTPLMSAPSEFLGAGTVIAWQQPSPEG